MAAQKIKTYIINLEQATVRRVYMENLLSQYKFLDIEFLHAVDGRQFTEAERAEVFDDKKCLGYIGRKPNGGEVGCTLSHRKFCDALLATDKPYAIVLEDDISPIRDLVELKLYDFDKILCTDVPTALMLSGDFWYTGGKDIVNVYDCVGTYAYAINRAGAKVILSEKACTVADNWRYHISNGLKIKAIKPYVIDANLKMDVLSSFVEQNVWGIDRSRMKKINVARGYWAGLIKKILKLCGHFEAKKRVINNVVVD